jgi:hypothetical protein
MQTTPTRGQSRHGCRSFRRTLSVPVLAFLTAAAGSTLAVPSRALADSGARVTGAASNSPMTVDTFMMIANIRLYEPPVPYALRTGQDRVTPRRSDRLRMP